MKIVLSNVALPSNGVASIPFPIPKADYDNCITTLETLDIGDVLAADCKVEEISGEYPILRQLEGTMVNVDEMDYLVKRLESLDKRELGQFQAVATSQGVRNIRDFINLTFCCQDVTIVQEFSDLKRIGKFCHMDRNGGVMPQDNVQHMDFEKVALDLLQSKEGKVTPYGVIYDKDFQMEQLYDGQHFPQYSYEDCVMELEITIENNAAGIYPASFYLPMCPRQLERTMLRNDLANCRNMELYLMNSSMPKEVNALLDLAEESLSDLNALCQAVADFSESDMAKYCAVVLFSEPTTAIGLKHLAEQLDLFDFVPGIRTPEEYGRHMICESGYFEYDENLAGYYNFKEYGSQRVEQESGRFTDNGYISYHGVVSIQELLDGVEYERMGMKMQ